MAAKVSSLTGELVLNINKWSAPIKAAERDVAALEKAMSPLASVASAVGGALVGMATATAAALATAVKVSADYGDKIRDASVRTGLTTEAMSALKLQAEQSGTSFETLNIGLQKLSQNFGQAAASGKGKAAEAFNAVGISVKELRDANGNLEPVMRKVMDRLAEVPSASQRAALGTALMGKGFNELQEFAAGGAAAIDAYRAKADLFGITVGQDAADAADNFNDALNNLKQASLGLTLTVGNALIPSVTEFIGWTAAALVSVKDLIAEMGKGDEDSGFVNFLGQAGLAIGTILIPGFTKFTPKVLENKAAIEASTQAEKQRNAELLAGQRTLLEKAAAEKAYAEVVKRGTNEIQRLQKQQLDRDLKEYQQSMEDREKANEHQFKVAVENMGAETKANLARIHAVDIARAESAKLAQKTEKDMLVSMDADLEAQERVVVASLKDRQRAHEDAADQVVAAQDRISKAVSAGASNAHKVWASAIGNITADFSRGIADIIFEGRKFGETMTSIAKSTAKSMFEAFLSGLLTPLTSKLGELGAELGKVIFGGGATGGGTGGGSLTAAFPGLAGGVLGKILGKGSAAGGVGASAAMSGALGWATFGAGLAPLAISAIGKIGAGRRSADEIVKSENALREAVGSIISDSSLSAVNKSKIVENLFSGFAQTAAAFSAGGDKNALTANQASANLMPWMTRIRADLARDVDAAGGTPQTPGAAVQHITQYFTITVGDAKNARSIAATFTNEIIPAFKQAIRSNTDGITQEITLGVKNSIAGVVTT